MTVSEFGRSGLALLMTPSGTIPRFCAIGSGSGANVASLGSLIAEVLAQRVDFSTRDISVSKNVTWVYDFNSVTMSGIFFREFGMGQTITKGANNLWMRDGFLAIEFDGTNELQIELTFEVF